ncbi:MAG: glycosyl transferase [Chloroflexota bacterium]|nr:MAG: glycosyl transferase [Chloroflexota bacterium]
MYHSILRPSGQRQLKNIGEADLVIGLPTFKNGPAAAHVARTALAGAHHYYPALRTVLINADAGHEAATRRAVAAQAANNGSRDMVVTSRYEGLLGQGSATAAILDAALALDAKAMVILDSQTQTITPNWLAGLAHLILEDKADLVTSRYRWSWPYGALSDLIVYPLFRALWGWSVRHPAAPDFALSPRLAAAILDEDIWETEVATFGLPPWLATYALLGPWRVAQSALGEKQLFPVLPSARTRQAEKRAIQRQTAQWQTQFQTVVSAMLRLVYDYQQHWLDVSTFDSLSTLTEFVSPLTSSAARSLTASEVDPAPLLDDLALGWMEYRLLWQQILTPINLASIEALAALPPDLFYFPADLWARIVYDFAVVFNKGECDPSQVVSSLWPLYQGRLAAFGQEVAGLSVVGYEGTVAAQAVEFEETRSYLKDRWQAYQSV